MTGGHCKGPLTKNMYVETKNWQAIGWQRFLNCIDANVALAKIADAVYNGRIKMNAEAVCYG